MAQQASRLHGKSARTGVPAVARLAMAIALLAGVVAAMWQLEAPAALPASAPATAFSADRALAHLDVIATEPRPLGSPGSDAAREYLLAEIEKLGLRPEVQTTTSIQRFPGSSVFNAGTVRNVVVRLPGTANTRAIALNAHYDGAATGPAASDCGSCVVTSLETLRALVAGPALRNDVIFVFSDGEENGDLGAGGFVGQHPWAEEVALALNFETQGNRGPSLMYFTSANNDWLIGEFARGSTYPFAHAAVTALNTVFASQRPGCDLEDYTGQGSLGLGFIYFLGAETYHTVRDSVDTIDPRSVQHDGEHALSLVRHFGNLDLRDIPASGEAVFFNLAPALLVHYPATWALPLAGLAALLVVAVVLAGVRARRLRVRGIVVGALVGLIGAVLAVALLTLVWVGLKASKLELQVMLIGFNGGDTFFVGLAALLVALLAGLYLLLMHRFRVSDLAAGGLVAGAIMAILTATSATGFSYLFVWPLLAGTLALAWIIFQGNAQASPWPRTAMLAVAALPGLVIALPPTYLILAWMYRLEGLSGLPLIAVPLLIPALLFGTMVPQLALLAGLKDDDARPSASAWLVPLAALGLGVALVGWTYVDYHFDENQPRPNSIAYQLDADSGQARWLSVDKSADGWTSQFFPEGMAGERTVGYPFLGLPAASAPAPSLQLAAPNVTAVEDVRESGGQARRIRLHVDSPRGAGALQVEVQSDVELAAASLDGREFDLNEFAGAERQSLRFAYYGLDDGGVELALRTRGVAPLKVTVSDGTTGLPAFAGQRYEPRPASTMPVPGPTVLDPTVVTKTFTFTP